MCLIAISKSDLVFLAKRISNEKLKIKINNLLCESPRRMSNQKYSLILTENEVDILEEELSNLLCENGFKKNDEPNEVGLKLESLIDLIVSQKYNR